MKLDPLQNRKEKEAQARKKETKPKLNPDFPYKPTAFSPSYFGVDKKPPTVDNRKKS